MLRIFIITFTIFFSQVALNLSKATNVHILVCSHLDAGWVETFEDYYVGRTRGKENVRKIYDSVISTLQTNKPWKYTISDLAFFHRWWKDQSSSIKKKVKALIANNQLEFVNGGWVANVKQHLIMRISWRISKLETDGYIKNSESSPPLDGKSTVSEHQQLMQSC